MVSVGLWFIFLGCIHAFRVMVMARCIGLYTKNDGKQVGLC
jgi:hypothetical protein